jgi:hypothetical protein
MNSQFVISSAWMYQALADAVVVFHFSFILFVLLGGALVLRWRRVAWLHLPAIAWGIFVEYSGWICPLTPLENRLRERGGLEQYSGDFVDRYLCAIIYPHGLTHNMQIIYGSIVAGVNVTFYAIILVRWWRSRPAAASGVSETAAPPPAQTSRK